MGSTFGLVFSLVISYFFILICQGSCKIKGPAYGWRVMIIPSRHCHFMACSILLMITWPSFLCYVITYNKDEQSRQTNIWNLGKFVDVNRCINLYIEKLYCVWNLYGVRWLILVYVNMCLMMYLINFYLYVWWL
jgi:hypothetical protein